MASASGDVTLTFPAGFLWGAATAAYQIEGAATEGGRTPSIWDTFSATPGKTENGDTGMVACDHYHRFRGDVQIMKELGLQAYRFSVSWPRILPAGRGAVNPEGVAFYNALIDELLAANIKPMITLYHWDMPQCLEDEYGGWLGRRVVDDFGAYASACFAAFGDRVKFWITLNEPWCMSILGFATGAHAPGKKGQEREPYIATHHMILAHAKAVQRYRGEFRPAQGGSIGITLNAEWNEPAAPAADAVEAQRRALAFSLGWYADPIYKGDYPAAMRERCGERLPVFTEEERGMVLGSSDFFGLNSYSTRFVEKPRRSPEELAAMAGGAFRGYFTDMYVRMRVDERWARTDMDWPVVPWGMQRLLAHIQSEYAPAGGIIITENGCAVREDTAAAAREDAPRVEYLQGYIAQVHRAIEGGADVRGYFAWSLLDNFEWGHGYSKRFGLVRVDYGTQERCVKASGRFYAEVARTGRLRLPAAVMAASEFAPLPPRGAAPPASKL